MQQVRGPLRGPPIPTSGKSKEQVYDEHKEHHQQVMPSKVQRVNIVMGNASISAAGAKLGGRDNWKGKNQDRDITKGIDPTTSQDGGRTGLGRRKHETHLFCTLNPNKGSMRSTKQGMQDDKTVQQALNYVVTQLSRDENLSRVITFGPTGDGKPTYGDVYRANDSYDTHIGNVTCSATIEKGGTYGRMHAHMVLVIDHWSQIQINSIKLSQVARKFYNDFLETSLGTEHLRLPPGRRMYANVKLLPQTQWNKIILQYLEKGIAASS